tara:strand:+ start:292 stop:3789 length:3498 start_codon:yes stop_codon:yes gene_type:complete
LKRPIRFKKNKHIPLCFLTLSTFCCDSSPDVSIETPVPADTVSEAVNIVVEATDNDSVVFVQLWLDGDSTDLKDDSEPYKLLWNTVDHGGVSNHNLVAVAFDVDGNKGESDTLKITINNSQSYPIPIEVKKTEFMDGRYALNWAMSSDEDFGSYEIERSPSPTMEESDILFTSTRSLDTTFIDTDLDFLVHNYYRIVVTDTLGFKSVGPVHRSDLYPLPFPADISAVSYNLDSMAVEWTASKGENFVEYRLLSAYSEDGPKKVEAIYDDIDANRHILTEFDPTRENWFWISTRNLFDQSTIGKGLANKVDDSPIAVNVSSVKYNLKKLIVDWKISNDDDFRRYELLHSQSKDGIRTMVASFDDQQLNKYQITEFDPTYENWFWVRTIDHWGQSSIGEPLTHERDKPPRPIEIKSVKYDLESMKVSWQRSKDRDFLSYEVLWSDSEMGEKELLEIITNPKQNIFSLNSFNPSRENWFWVRVTDYWGLTYKGEGKTHPIDSPPKAADVDSVIYDEQKMSIFWEASIENDFSYYELFVSDTEFGARRPIVKIGASNRNNYVLRHFDPTKENWFSIDVVDKWGIRSIGKAKSNDANSPPEAIRITDVNYTYENFNIKWEQTAQNDFSFYELMVSNQRDGIPNRLATLSSSEDTTYSISGRGIFDPTKEQWFFIKTGDIWGQEVIGPGYRVFDEPPIPSNIHSIEYRKGQFSFEWSPNNEDDFRRYNLYESMTSDMLNEEKVYSSVINKDTSTVIKGIDPWETRYYRLEVEDVWGLRSSGMLKKADSQSWFLTQFGDENQQEGRSVTETKDGGFIISGHTYSNANNGDVWLVKTDPKGNIDWSKTFGGEGDDHAYSIQLTSDGGYVIAGFSEALAEKWSDAWVIKTNSKGLIEWNRTYGGFRWDKAHDIQETKDGGYIITGYTFSHGNGNADIWLIKTDKDGYPIWSKTFGGPDWDYGYSVKETRDGGYIITGFTEGEDKESSRIWLVKTNVFGEEMWSHTFGGRQRNEGRSIIETEDGGYILAGTTQNFFPNYEDVIIIRTNEEGKSLWEKTFGGQSWDRSSSVIQTKEGNFVVAGSSRLNDESTADSWLMKFDSNGNQIWEKKYSNSFDDDIYSIENTTDGGFVMVGTSTSIDGSPSNLLIIKTDFKGDIPKDDLHNNKNWDIIIGEQ